MLALPAGFISYSGEIIAASMTTGLTLGLRAIWLIALLLPAAFPASAADLTLKVVDKEPPPELAETIRKALPSKAVQLLDGDKPALEFWFSAEVPVKARTEGAKVLDAVAPTVLLGAVFVPRAARDYKDNEIAAGVYTLRLALQPQDGDHLGTADYLWFGVLVAAKNDPKLDGLDTYRALVKASAAGTASAHPLVLSLRPVTGDEGAVPRLTEPAEDHKAIRVKLPAKVDGKNEKASLLFELVYQGKYKG